MSRNDPKNPRKKAAEAELRQQRLAEALRANLRRRKTVKTPPKPETSEKPAGGKE